MRFAIIPDVQTMDVSENARNRGITHLIIHHSATMAGDAESFHRYHTASRPYGRGWRDIGYHYVVPNGITMPKGIIQLGRDRDDDDDVMEHNGAHVLGMNKHTLGICGTGNFDETEPIPEDQQIRSIAILVCQLMRILDIPVHRVLGHREAGSIDGVPKVHKTCPGSKVCLNAMRDFFHYVNQRKFQDWADEYSAMIQRLRIEVPGLNILNSGG